MKSIKNNAWNKYFWWALYILYILKQYYVFYIFVFLSMNHKIWHIILINIHFCKQEPQKWNLYSWWALLIPIKTKTSSNEFVFLFQCLISLICLKKHFLKLLFVLKNHSLSKEYFFQKCSWQQFLKIQVSASTAACLKPKKELNEPFVLTKLEKPK